MSPKNKTPGTLSVGGIHRLRVVCVFCVCAHIVTWFVQFVAYYLSSLLRTCFYKWPVMYLWDAVWCVRSLLCMSFTTQFSTEVVCCFCKSLRTLLPVCSVCSLSTQSVRYVLNDQVVQSVSRTFFSVLISSQKHEAWGGEWNLWPVYLKLIGVEMKSKVKSQTLSVTVGHSRERCLTVPVILLFFGQKWLFCSYMNED